MTRYTTTTTTTTTRRPTLMQRLRGQRTRRTHATGHPRTHHARTGHTTAGHTTAAHTTAAPVHHHRRRPSIGDKISGGLMRLKGTLTRRPGVKAAGTRRMHGTDGRGSHRVY